MTRKKILLTGATGTMGNAALHELLKRDERFDITVLSLDDNRSQLKLKGLDDRIRIVWGDLACYDDVAKAVKGADYVLHVGGMVSPAADYFPKKTMSVNVTAAQNIVKAVLAQPNADDIRVCYIGSVAQTGHRNPPVHWGRTGDPINISIYDHYAISKTIAERCIVESGIKHWVCLRQSGIIYPDILKSFDPIMFHVPLNGVLEWTTVEDSGRVLANLCEDDVLESFWNRFYNIGSGTQYRLTNYEFECKLLKAISCPPPEKIFQPEWFVLRNFHGQWFSDSDLLESFLHFRANVPVDEYFENMRHSVSSLYRLAPLAPSFAIKMAMRTLAYKKKWGTQYWIRHHDSQRISAYYGSIDKWKHIPDWKHQDLSHPSDEPTLLDHGFDENKPLSELDLSDLRQAAAFRGGKCLSSDMEKGDLTTPLEWECQFGHRFKASATLVLLGGHWCPECLPMPWNYDAIAKGNPFFAQVWRPFHDETEDNRYDERIFDGWDS